MPNEDVNIKGILIFLGILILTVLAAYGAVSATSRHWEAEALAADAQTVRQLPPSTNRPYFPAPREQPNPIVDLQTFRAQEDAELHSYGWIDKSNGIVRIPIERALDIMAQSPNRHP